MSNLQHTTRSAAFSMHLRRVTQQYNVQHSAIGQSGTGPVCCRPVDIVQLGQFDDAYVCLRNCVSLDPTNVLYRS